MYPQFQTQTVVSKYHQTADNLFAVLQPSSGHINEKKRNQLFQTVVDTI